MVPWRHMTANHSAIAPRRRTLTSPSSRLASDLVPSATARPGTRRSDSSRSSSAPYAASDAVSTKWMGPFWLCGDHMWEVAQLWNGSVVGQLVHTVLTDFGETQSGDR